MIELKLQKLGSNFQNKSLKSLLCAPSGEIAIIGKVEDLNILEVVQDIATVRPTIEHQYAWSVQNSYRSISVDLYRVKLFR